MPQEVRDLLASRGLHLPTRGNLLRRPHRRQGQGRRQHRRGEAGRRHVRIHTARGFGRAGEHAALNREAPTSARAPANSQPARLRADPPASPPTRAHAGACPHQARRLRRLNPRAPAHSLTRKDPKWKSISGPFVRRLVSRKLPFSLLQTFERGTHGVDGLIVRHHDGFVAGEHHRVLVHHLYIVA